MKGKQQHSFVVKDIESLQELSEIEIETIKGGYKPWYCKYTGCQDEILIGRLDKTSIFV